ncbi:TlpA family protein disulfide reductase [Sphingobacterium sp. KU25419]|nr:TlpA family protein disulfide reductase [Sphingobacterium sp. KU25419]
MNIDKFNNRKIHIDDDFDNDFTNNTEHVFTPETTSYPIINLRRRQVIGNDTIVFYQPYELRVFDNRIKIGNRTMELTLTEAWYKEGKFKYQGQEYIIRLKETLLTKDGKNDIFLKYKLANDTSKFSNPYKIGDTIRLDDKRYVLQLDENILSFIYVGKYDSTAYNFKRKDLISQKEIQLSQFKDKYILLDFWGSWCVPCIEGIPDLKQLAKDYKGKIEIISIAFDHDEDISKLKSIISEHEMDWTHIKEPRIFNNESGLNNKFDVKSFPTFILIDKKGNIILIALLLQH